MNNNNLLLKAKLLSHYRDKIINAKDLSLYEHIINQVTSIIDIITLSKKPKFMLYDKINQIVLSEESSLSNNNNTNSNNIDIIRYTIYKLIENYFMRSNDNDDNSLAMTYSYYKTIEENYDRIKEYIDHFLNNPRGFLVIVDDIPLTEDVAIDENIVNKYIDIIDTVLARLL